MSFKKLNLDNKIITALEDLGYINPSDVQREAIPYLLKGNDLIVKSKTGSGKTAAFSIPACQIVNTEENDVQVLILVPTRELALQVKEEIGNIGRLKKVRAAAIFGKMPYNDQIRELKQRVHIVVGTPGRIIDHLNRGTLKIEKIKFMIIDEGDKMLNMGFIDQLTQIFDMTPKEKMTALFSATVPREIKVLCEKYMNKPVELDVKAKFVNEGKIYESYVSLEKKDKLKTLWKYLYAKNPESTIVFCNTKDEVKAITTLLKKEGIVTCQIHGDMKQSERIDVMKQFKNKEYKVMVATDLAARGIHIDHIQLVVNYEVPMEQDSYVHRIGRTGRAGKEGEAVTFVSPFEEKFLKAIEEYIGREVPVGEIPSEAIAKACKNKFKDAQRKMLAERKQGAPKEVISGVMKLHLSGGKKKKLRAFDIVGTMSNLKGLTGDDIGIIDVQDGFSYVDILNGKGNLVLKNHREVTIKGKKIRVTKAKS
ncbi:MAG: DEAD/DEAH box helicase [Sarcina sp.]